LADKKSRTPIKLKLLLKVGVRTNPFKILINQKG
jgi:hypothetical protein